MSTKPLAQGQLKKLQTIIDATQSEAGMVYMSQKSVKVLVDGDYVECNTQMVDAQGNVAVRATKKGIDAMSNPDTPAAASTDATATTPTYAVESGVPMVALKRNRIAGTSIYPFDALEAPVTAEDGSVTYSSFFVPATEARPDPSKSLASTVSTASKRYATQNGTRTINRRNKETGELEPHEVANYDYQRKFVARRVMAEDGTTIAGARVYRTL